MLRGFVPDVKTVATFSAGVIHLMIAMNAIVIGKVVDRQGVHRIPCHPV